MLRRVKVAIHYIKLEKIKVDILEEKYNSRISWMAPKRKFVLIKLRDLDLVVIRKLSVLQFSILVLVKVWNRMTDEQDCDDCSVILQTKSLL